MQRVGLTVLACCRVHVQATEELFLHLAFDRRGQPRVVAEVAQRFVECLRDDREPASRVQYAAGPLLNQQDEVASTARPSWRSRRCEQSQRPTCAKALVEGYH